MEIQELQQRARALGLDCPATATKARVIHAIQRRLGQTECFADDRRYVCGARQSDCEWRADCVRPIAEWRRG